MTGQELWQLFLDAKVPDAELIALGEDAGHKRPASPPAQQALLKIAAYAASVNGSKILFSPSYLLAAMINNLPGMLERKALLESIAFGYKKKFPYGNLPPGIQGYINALGMDLPAMPAAPKKSAMGAESTFVNTMHSVFENQPAQADSAMGADAIPMDEIFKKVTSAAMGGSQKQPPKGLTVAEWNALQSTVQRLSSEPTKVDAYQLATARNLAARGNLTSLKGALDYQITVRGDGALDPDRNPGMPPPPPPPGSPDAPVTEEASKTAMIGIVGSIMLLFLFLS
jgi:hypothetical protein